MFPIFYSVFDLRLISFYQVCLMDSRPYEAWASYEYGPTQTKILLKTLWDLGFFVCLFSFCEFIELFSSINFIDNSLVKMPCKKYVIFLLSVLIWLQFHGIVWLPVWCLLSSDNQNGTIRYSMSLQWFGV